MHIEGMCFHIFGFVEFAIHDGQICNVQSYFIKSEDSFSGYKIATANAKTLYAKMQKGHIFSLQWQSSNR